MICVDCGADVEGLIDGSCASCFAKLQPLMVVPEVIQVELCAHCGARHVGAHWYDTPADEPEIFVLEDAARQEIAVHQEVRGPMVDVELEEKDNKTFAATVSMEGRVEDVRVSADATCLLRRTRGVCNRCSRINGGYYASILQMRANGREMTPPELEIAHKIVSSELTRQIDAGNRFAFLAKSGPMHGGFDYYVGDIDAGRNVARRLKVRLGGAVHESAKLVGKKEGEDVYRVTFLIRMAELSPGDVVIRDEVPHAVLAVHPKTLATMDLEHQRRGRISPDHLRRLGGIELIQSAVVVSSGPDGVMILDPETHRTETILVPAGEAIEDQVPVVRVDERLYWVPWPAEATNNP